MSLGYLTVVLLVVHTHSYAGEGAVVPGYLDFDNLPDTNFSCEGKVIGGYYADVETGCQMFHVCTRGQKGELTDIKFLCLNGTVFDQQTRVCERVDEVDCSQSEDFYGLNLELYGHGRDVGHDDEDEEGSESQEQQTEVPSSPEPPPPPPPPPTTGTASSSTVAVHPFVPTTTVRSFPSTSLHPYRPKPPPAPPPPAPPSHFTPYGSPNPHQTAPAAPPDTWPHVKVHGSGGTGIIDHHHTDGFHPLRTTSNTITSTTTGVREHRPPLFFSSTSTTPRPPPTSPHYFTTKAPVVFSVTVQQHPGAPVTTGDHRPGGHVVTTPAVHVVSSTSSTSTVVSSVKVPGHASVHERGGHVSGHVDGGHVTGHDPGHVNSFAFGINSGLSNATVTVSVSSHVPEVEVEPPPSYEDYHEAHVSLDPFFKDVPRLPKTARRRRRRRHDDSQDLGRVEITRSRTAEDTPQGLRRAEVTRSRTGEDRPQDLRRAEFTRSGTGEDTVQGLRMAEFTRSRTGEDTPHIFSRAEFARSRTGADTSQVPRRANVTRPRSREDTAQDFRRAGVTRSRSGENRSQDFRRAEVTMSRTGEDTPQDIRRSDVTRSRSGMGQDTPQESLPAERSPIEQARPEVTRSRTNPQTESHDEDAMIPMTPMTTMNTSFTCADKVAGGYYADLEADCQLFHICSQGRHGRITDHRFLCGPGTRFSQLSRTCQSRALVDCGLSAGLYHVNSHFGQRPGAEMETGTPARPRRATDGEPHADVCSGRSSEGLYADTNDDARCRSFHLCQQPGPGVALRAVASFSCPPGTAFSDVDGVCDAEDLVVCKAGAASLHAFRKTATRTSSKNGRRRRHFTDADFARSHVLGPASLYNHGVLKRSFEVDKHLQKSKMSRRRRDLEDITASVGVPGYSSEGKSRELGSSKDVEEVHRGTFEDLVTSAEIQDRNVSVSNMTRIAEDHEVTSSDKEHEEGKSSPSGDDCGEACGKYKELDEVVHSVMGEVEEVLTSGKDEDMYNEEREEVQSSTLADNEDSQDHTSRINGGGFFVVEEPREAMPANVGQVNSYGEEWYRDLIPKEVMNILRSRTPEKVSSQGNRTELTGSVKSSGEKESAESGYEDYYEDYYEDKNNESKELEFIPPEVARVLGSRSPVDMSSKKNQSKYCKGDKEYTKYRKVNDDEMKEILRSSVDEKEYPMTDQGQRSSPCSGEPHEAMSSNRGQMNDYGEEWYRDLIPKEVMNILRARTPEKASSQENKTEFTGSVKSSGEKRSAESGYEEYCEDKNNESKELEFIPPEVARVLRSGPSVDASPGWEEGSRADARGNEPKFKEFLKGRKPRKTTSGRGGQKSKADVNDNIPEVKEFRSAEDKSSAEGDVVYEYEDYPGSSGKDTLQSSGEVEERTTECDDMPAEDGISASHQYTGLEGKNASAGEQDTELEDKRLPAADGITSAEEQDTDLEDKRLSAADSTTSVEEEERDLEDERLSAADSTTSVEEEESDLEDERLSAADSMTSVEEEERDSVDERLSAADRITPGEEKRVLAEEQETDLEDKRLSEADSTTSVEEEERESVDERLSPAEKMTSVEEEERELVDERLSAADSTMSVEEEERDLVDERLSAAGRMTSVEEEERDSVDEKLSAADRITSGEEKRVLAEEQAEMSSADNTTTTEEQDTDLQDKRLSVADRMTSVEEEERDLVDERLSPAEKMTSVEEEERDLVDERLSPAEKMTSVEEEERDLEDKRLSAADSTTSIEEEERDLVDERLSAADNMTSVEEEERDLVDERLSAADSMTSVEEEERDLVDERLSAADSMTSVEEEERDLVDERLSAVDSMTSVEEEERDLVDERLSAAGRITSGEEKRVLAEEQAEKMSPADNTTTTEEQDTDLQEKRLSVADRMTSVEEEERDLVDDRSPAEKMTSVEEEERDLEDKRLSAADSTTSIEEEERDLVDERLLSADSMTSVEEEERDLVDERLSAAGRITSGEEKRVSAKEQAEKRLSVAENTTTAEEQDAELEDKRLSVADNTTTAEEQDTELEDKRLSVADNTTTAEEQDTELEGKRMSVAARITSGEEKRVSAAGNTTTAEEHGTESENKRVSAVEQQEDNRLIAADRKMSAEEEAEDNRRSAADRRMPVEYKGLSSANRRMSAEDKGSSAADNGMSVEDKSLSAADRKMSVANNGLSSADRSVSVEDKGLSSADRRMSVEDKGLSSADRRMSVEDKGLSSADRRMSVEDKGLSSAGRRMLAKDKGLSGADRRMSAEVKGLSAAGRKVSAEEQEEPPQLRRTPEDGLRQSGERVGRIPNLFHPSRTRTAYRSRFSLPPLPPITIGVKEQGQARVPGVSGMRSRPWTREQPETTSSETEAQTPSHVLPTFFHLQKGPEKSWNMPDLLPHFTCSGKEMHRYYSDPGDCRRFHYCSPGFHRKQILDFRFTCDGNTVFSEADSKCMATAGIEPCTTTDSNT